MRATRARSATLVALACAALAVAPRRASAHTPPPEYEDPRPPSAFLEVAPWLALGAGASEVGVRDQPLFDLALDLGATLRIDDVLRIGLWGSVRTATFATFEPVVGLRLSIAPDQVHWFGVDGRWTIALDAGAGYAVRDASRFGLGDGPVLAAQLSWGFVAPLHLLDAYPWRCEERPETYGERCVPPAGVVSGARLYVQLRRGLAPAEEWEVTAGLELELLGSAWFLGGGG